MQQKTTHVGLESRMETENPAAPTESEPVLRSAISSLRHFLAKFGLVPSRILLYIQNIQFTNLQLRTFVRHERNDNMHLAVESFMELFLGDEAPPRALVSFMQALFNANNDSDSPDSSHINDGAWYVHDIINLACTYMPLQQALLDFLSQSQCEDQDQGQDVIDIQAVLTQMNRLRLLNPQFTAHVMETREVQGIKAAIIHLLTCMYATRVDMLKERFLAEENSARERGNGIAMVPEPFSRGRDLQQHWLHSFIQCIEMNGGQGITQSVPEAMLSAETWTSAYNCLAFGRRGRMEHDEDAVSDAGDSVASDETLTLGEEEEEETIPGETERLSAKEEIAMNMDVETRQKRTFDYVYGGIGQDIQHTFEIFHHEYQRRDVIPAAVPRQPSELDDSGSVITTASTENNSHVDDDDDAPVINSNFWAARDRSRTLFGEEHVTLHAYQEEVLQWAREGQNVAIFMPTGTGKTFVVLKYVQEYLNRPGLNRVVFLAPKVKLAEQQFQRFRKYFPKVTYFRCGNSRSSTAPFSELLDTYQVFVMTPQCLVEAIQRKEVQMTDFSMLVLDECHHVGQGKHAYMGLMGLYLDAKFKEEANLKKLPQVIGLTASPGVGSGKTLTSAISHVKELCYKMDVEKINIVKNHTQELQYHVNEPKHELHTCRRRKFDGFKKFIEEIMEHIENRMITCAETESQLIREEKEIIKLILKAPTEQRGHPQYNSWVSNLDNKLMEFAEHKSMYHQLFSMTEMLIIYQKSLILNEDCESLYALEYLKDHAKILEDQVPHDVGASLERKLLDQFYRYQSALERVCNDPEDYNPKLEMLEEILLELIEKNGEDCACLVFVRTVELTKALERWMNENRQLSCLHPGRMTGRKRTNTDGMTRPDMSGVIEKFRRGEHKLLVCTSAADEGLDFQACNIVVRYDYVTSLISMIQTRGRARQMDSQYCVLGNLFQGNIDKEKENLASERLMHQAVDKVIHDIQENSNAFVAEKGQWQKDEYLRRRMEEQRISIKARNKVNSGNVYHILCRKCQIEACMSTDFRMLDHSSRTVVATYFADRWKRVETNRVVQFRNDLEKIAKVHCKNCSFDWGVLVRDIPNNRELPVLKIESFILKDAKTGVMLRGKLKWSDAPFQVEDISNEELSVPVV